ncbi:hypothetical protein LENED_008714 [Lentinula edodes]|uniref:Uncharacterized protein n=1 Tax=Lentinula edodes TaxID=5353 RepID=A0A1Q3EHR7_LENED|nr:hypothetical protein LENED_008714 [Lentinula edodes]
MSYDDAIAEFGAYEALLSQRLSVVASLIDTIKFEKSQFAVLVSDAQQTRLVTQPSDDILPLTAPLGWLPRIQESDLYVWLKVDCLKCETARWRTILWPNFMKQILCLKVDSVWMIF